MDQPFKSVPGSLRDIQAYMMDAQLRSLSHVAGLFLIPLLSQVVASLCLRSLRAGQCRMTCRTSSCWPVEHLAQRPSG